MMKIGLYAKYLSAINLGAPRYYFVNLAMQLLKCKNVDLYLIYDKMGDHPLYSETQKVMLPRLPILNVLELRRQKLDLIHFNALPTTPRELSIALFMKNVKKVATIHGDIIYANPRLYDYGRSYMANYKRFMQPKVSRWLDMLMPVSRNLGSRLLQYWSVSEKKLRPIHHGIDHDIFKPIADSKKRVIQKYGLERDFILHLSNYSLRKNPSGLLNTYEQLIDEGVDLDLVIIGKRWKEGIHEFLSNINSEKVRQKIKVFGSLPLGDLPLFYAAAKLFFFPSYHENFGFPNVEAMACGTPVVTAKVYSIPEVTGDAAILCDPDNVSGFVSAIKSVLEDENLRDRMIRKGLDNAKKFTWEKCAKETVEVYKEVIIR